MKAPRIALILLATAACGSALPGNAIAETLPSVEVSALRHPAAWPYQHFLAGLDEFDDQRSLAPDGRLQFRLRPDRIDVELGEVVVKLETATRDYVLPLTDGKFSLPRLNPDERAEARIVLNQRQHQYSFHMPRAVVHTAGLKDDVLRLGDLRLACKVNMAVFKSSIGMLQSLGLSLLARRTDWCRVEKNGGQSCEAPFAFRVLTMTTGSRHERQAFDQPSRHIKLPLENADWPDSTLIRIEP
jgi:hypothetical protein